MEHLRDNDLLQFHPDTLESIRKIRGFNSRKEVDDAIDILDTWAKQQNHFLEKNFDRRYMERVILSCKGSLERSKKQIDRLCTIRTLRPFKTYIQDIDVKNLGEILDPSVWAFSLLPKLTKDHDRIVMFRLNAKKFTFEMQVKIFQTLALFGHFIRYNDYCNSYILIVDYTKADMSSIISNVNIPEYINFAGAAFQGYGIRLKQIHNISSSFLFETLIKISKFGLPEKLHNRIHIHRKYKTVHDYVPVELLPKDYGGNEESLDKLYVKTMDVFGSEDFRKHRREMNNMCTDESKRRTDTFNEQYMGMPGTFRTLNVD